jgi:Mu transposase, C-terminal domain
MKFAKTQILGRLRRQTFFSLEEASDAIKLALERMNNHIMRRLGVSCSDLFASIERPALGALPAARYEYAEWRLVRVSIDHHVEVDHFLYSVLHTLLREQVNSNEDLLGIIVAQSPRFRGTWFGKGTRAVIVRHGKPRKYRPVADFKFLIDVMKMDLDGAIGKIEPPPNFLVRQPLRHQSHDLALAVRQHR